MRTIKNPEERRSEILDAAEMFFTTKGYAKTTILDILNEIGIAKGTFYYYFKSKEEVMDAIIMRIVESDVAAARQIVNLDIPVLDKLFQILMSQTPQMGGSKEKLLEQFHQPSNAEMHQKSLAQAILHITPVLTEVVEQGIQEGIFSTAYPQETMEFLVASAQIIFDEGIFQWEPHEALQRAKAFVNMLEVTLGASKGSFDYILTMLAGPSGQ